MRSAGADRPGTVRRRSDPPPIQRVVDSGSRVQLVLVIGIVIWGALAFGAVYPWAYWPLGVVCGAAGVFGLVTTAAIDHRPGTAVLVAMIVLTSAVLLQLIPLPGAALNRISPNSEAVLTGYDLQYVADGGSAVSSAIPGWRQHAHALSIEPRQTWTAVALLVAFELLLVGLARRLEADMVVALVRATIALGLAMAMIGFIQQATFSGKIYGFWTPESTGPLSPFGPFVNRNHYAGWMLMAVPLGIGLVLGLVSQAARTVDRSWRHRLLWISTPAGGTVVLAAFTLAVMILSVPFSLSRSGIVCLFVSLVGLGLFAVRRFTNLAGSLIAVALLTVVLVLSIGWAGSDRLALRLDGLQRDGLGGRAAVWSDAWRMARAHPIAGTGLGTFGVGMLFYQTPPRDKRYLEAHNEYLQLAAEGGWLLTVPALLLLVSLIREIHRRFAERLDDERVYWIRVGAVTGLLSIALQAVFDFSLQMPGNAALFCVLMAIALHHSSSPGAPRLVRTGPSWPAPKSPGRYAGQGRRSAYQ